MQQKMMSQAMYWLPAFAGEVLGDKANTDNGRDCMHCTPDIKDTICAAGKPTPVLAGSG